MDMRAVTLAWLVHVHDELAWARAGLGMVQGGYNGWVYRGVLPVHQAATRKQAPTAKRAP